MNINYQQEVELLAEHHSYITDSVSNGAYTGNLLNQISHAQNTLDHWHTFRTTSNANEYAKARSNLMLMLEGAGL